MGCVRADTSHLYCMQIHGEKEGRLKTETAFLIVESNY